MKNILEKIAETRECRIKAEKALVPLEELKARAAAMPPSIDVMRLKARQPALGRAVIAEVKRKSPSRGELRPGLDPSLLAAAYERGGAFAVSCLVEPDWFGGSLTDLDQVRKAVKIPVLYKDFVVDPYQIWQARAHGADMVLLIVSLLGKKTCDYLEEAHKAGIYALVEIHDEEEAQAAVETGAAIIGVNNRNLKTFVTDIAVSERIIPTLPHGTLAIAESGIKTPEDMDRLTNAGADAFLIGESLLTAGDPETELRRIIHT